MTIKGYVVRGKSRREHDTWAAQDAAGFMVTRERAEAANYSDLDCAIEAFAFMHAKCHDIRIIAITEDGAETALPTYEEAITDLADLWKKASVTTLALQSVYQAGVVIRPCDPATLAAFDDASRTLRETVIALGERYSDKPKGPQS